MVDIKKFEDYIQSNLWKILQKEYADNMDTLPDYRVIYKGTEINDRTKEPYYLFNTTVLEYVEELVPNPEWDIELVNGNYKDTAPEFIDQGKYVPVNIELGIDNNFKIVEFLIDD